MLRTALTVFILILFFTGNGMAQTPQSRTGDPGLRPMITSGTTSWRRVDRTLPMPDLQILWRGDPFVAPSDLIRHGNALFVMDAGHPTDRANASRIIRIPLVNEQPGRPEVFFQRPGELLSVKWAVPISKDTLAIADQGEVIGREFTGKGAKIFTISVQPDGTASEPSVLWRGAPFVCPTGIARLDDYLYVTDPCAGPMRTRSDAPDVASMTSALFALPLDKKGPPKLLWEGDPFVSLISIELRQSGNVPQLHIADVDSGRIDRSGFEVRRSALAERDTRGVHRRNCTSLRFCAAAASTDIWVIDIVDASAPRVQAPHRFPLLEEGPIKLRFDSVPADSTINLVARDGARFLNGSATYRIEYARISNNELDIAIESPTHRESIVLGVEIRDNQSQRLVSQAELSIPKDLSQAPGVNDYKKGRVIKKGNRRYVLMPDTALGRGAVYVVPEDGGTPVALARGAPFVRPFSIELSGDGNTMWIIDEGGMLLSLPVPDAQLLEETFKPRPDPIR